MSKTNSSRRFQLVWSVLFLAGVAALPAAARGEEPHPDCPKCCTVEKGVPILNKIPFVCRLFKNVGYKGQECAPQVFGRIDIDHDSELCHEWPQQAALRLPLPLGTLPAPQQVIMLRGIQQVHGPLPFGQAIRTYTPAQFCQAAECQASACKTAECQASTEPCCSDQCEESDCCQAPSRSARHAGPSWEQIVDLTAENAALEAMLEAEAEFQKEKSEMLDSLVQLSLEKGKLEAQVELHGKHTELIKEMLALMTENARLKAQSEVVEAKLALIQGMTHLTLENEQLKQQLAAATRPHEPAKEPQTSNRPYEAKAAR